MAAATLLTRPSVVAQASSARVQCQQPGIGVLPRRPTRVVSQVLSAQQQQQSARTSSAVSLAGVLLAAGGPLTMAAAALADPEAGAEVALAVQDASQAAQQATQQAGDAVQQAASQGPTPIGILIVLSPILAYGLFSLYRAKINPRAKLGDAVYILAAGIIVGNLLSIVIFKKRFF